MGETLLEVKNMTKKFGPIVALKGVDLTISRGEIHGLIGENGSGKSTITSIAAGMQQATSGEMFYKGKPWKPSSMIEAQANGISMILQEANTIGGCTVAENLFAGQETRFSRYGFFNTKKLNAAADELLAKFELTNIRGKDPIERYGFEERKLVELARAVTDDTEILVVDETTTALSMEGREILYRLMNKLIARDKAVIFISHDLDEIMAKCTKLTVLRDGEIRGTIDRAGMDAPDAVRYIRGLMVGRDIGDKLYRSDYDTSHTGETALEIKHLYGCGIRDLNLTLHKGEIIGLGGLSGCGMHEIGRMAFGLTECDMGEIICDGKKVTNPQEAISAGMGYISKDRDREAVILEAPIRTNISMASLRDLQKLGFISPWKEKKLVKTQMDNLAIKARSGAQWVNTLSGGNKQKVSFAKWMAKGSDVVIMDCPTRGVDVGVKQAMYELINQMKQSGKAMLMISEEMSELIGMADRLLILKDFQVAKEFTRSPDLKAALKLPQKKAAGTIAANAERIAQVVGCEEHISISKDVADKSITIVKEEPGVLPLTPAKYPRILVYPKEAGATDLAFGAETRTAAVVERLVAEGFKVDVYKPSKGFEGIEAPTTAVTDNYDALIYVANYATKSNQTVVRLEWAQPMGADCPMFLQDMPNIFISLENPYHLVDVPRMRTYINTYGASDEVLDALVEKLTGKSAFKGKSPVDAFCGKWDAHLM